MIYIIRAKCQLYLNLIFGNIIQDILLFQVKIIGTNLNRR